MTSSSLESKELQNNLMQHDIIGNSFLCSSEDNSSRVTGRSCVQKILSKFHCFRKNSSSNDLNLRWNSEG